MPWSGGSFTRVHDWTTDAGSAINIEADRMDAEDDNLQAGINDCIHKGGQNAATSNLPMGGNKHTGVGNAAARDQYASAADVMDQDLIYYVDTGAADAYAITPSPAITAYEEGQRFVFRATNANTGASTLNINSLGATTIRTNDGSTLASGDIIVGGYYGVTYDANGSRFVLTSPTSRLPFYANSDVNHDATTNYVADKHVAHSGVSVIAASGGLAASNNDLSSNIGLSVDVSTLAQFTATDPVDLDVDQIILDDGGTEKRALGACMLTPEIDTTVTGLTDTLDETNFGKIVPYSNTGTVTITLPNGLKTGFWCVLRKTGATGTMTLSATTTLETKNGATDIVSQYGGGR